jgi:hypothetical protein
MCLVDETEEIERSSDRIAEVSRGRSSRWSNDHPGRAGKLAYRAKGRTANEPGVEHSRDEYRRQTSPDRGPGGKAKAVKPTGSSLRAEQSPASTTNKG